MIFAIKFAICCGKELRFMQRIFSLIGKQFVVAFIAFALLFQVVQLPALASETQSEKIEAISELMDEGGE